MLCIHLSYACHAHWCDLVISNPNISRWEDAFPVWAMHPLTTRNLHLQQSFLLPHVSCLQQHNKILSAALLCHAIPTFHHRTTAVIQYCHYWGKAVSHPLYYSSIKFITHYASRPLHMYMYVPLSRHKAWHQSLVPKNSGSIYLFQYHNRSISKVTVGSFLSYLEEFL